MTKTEIQKEEKTSDITTIETQRKALSNQITDLLSEITEISSRIQQAEQRKTQAKAGYNNCLDSGDESGMSKALSLIREANSTKQKLTESLCGFSEKIETLRTAYNELMSAARTLRADAEKKLQEFQNQFRQTQLVCDQCGNVLNGINDLVNVLQSHKDRVSPKEPPTKTGDMRIEGNI